MNPSLDPLAVALTLTPDASLAQRLVDKARAVHAINPKFRAQLRRGRSENLKNLTAAMTRWLNETPKL